MITSVIKQKSNFSKICLVKIMLALSLYIYIYSFKLIVILSFQIQDNVI